MLYFCKLISSSIFMHNFVLCVFTSLLLSAACPSFFQLHDKSRQFHSLYEHRPPASALLHVKKKLCSFSFLSLWIVTKGCSIMFPPAKAHLKHLVLLFSCDTDKVSHAFILMFAIPCSLSVFTKLSLSSSLCICKVFNQLQETT